MRNRVLGVAAGLATLVLIVASPVWGEKVDRRFHQAFDVQEGTKLVLHHGDGEVSITPWEKSTIDVEVVYRASIKKAGSGSVRDFDVEFDQSGDTVRVIGKEPSIRVNLGLSYHWEREYSYTVKAPRWVALELEGEDGDVSIREWSGDIAVELKDGDLELTEIASSSTRLELDDGDLDIEGLQGDFWIRGEDGDIKIRNCKTTAGSIRTSDGDVTLERCEGNIEVTGVDGRLMLSQIRGEKLDIRTSDGRVELDLLASDALDLTIHSGDGSVAVGLDPRLSVAFTIQTDDGDVRLSGIEVADLQKDRRHTSGRIGDGKGNMKITTGDGDVVLRQD